MAEPTEDVALTAVIDAVVDVVGDDGSVRAAVAAGRRMLAAAAYEWPPDTDRA